MKFMAQNIVSNKRGFKSNHCTYIKPKPQRSTKTCLMKWPCIVVEYFKRITKKLFENNENKSPTHVDIRYPYLKTSVCNDCIFIPK